MYWNPVYCFRETYAVNEPEQEHHKLADRTSELVFNVLWLYVEEDMVNFKRNNVYFRKNIYKPKPPDLLTSPQPSLTLQPPNVPRHCKTQTYPLGS